MSPILVKKAPMATHCTGPAQVRFAEVGPTEVRAAKVRLAKVRLAEVGPAEVRPVEVYPFHCILFPPSVTFITPCLTMSRCS